MKVWDFSTGQQLKSFMPPDSHVDVPVAYLQYLTSDSQRTLLAVYANQSAIHLLVRALQTHSLNMRVYLVLQQVR